MSKNPLATAMVIPLMMAGMRFGQHKSNVGQPRQTPAIPRNDDAHLEAARLKRERKAARKGGSK
jgi:hypothetical protein